MELEWGSWGLGWRRSDFWTLRRRDVPPYASIATNRRRDWTQPRWSRARAAVSVERSAHRAHCMGARRGTRRWLSGRHVVQREPGLSACRSPAGAVRGTRDNEPRPVEAASSAGHHLHRRAPRPEPVAQRLAGVAAVSTSHFKTLFKRSTGLPPHEYVVHRRVERAKSLLLRGDRPSSQAALEAGFAHQSHMVRWMRRILGATPGSRRVPPGENMVFVTRTSVQTPPQRPAPKR